MSVPSSTPLRVLLLGGTGYIGGSALDHLLKNRPNLAKQFAFTLVVRDQGKADQLQQRYPEAKLNIVLTSHADTAKITELAAQSDVVLNLADADDLNLAKAINEGLAKRAAAGGRRPVLIHTSGTSVFSDPKEEDGNHTTKHTYSDAHPEDFWALPASAPHHAIDLEVVKAQDAGVNVLLVIPCTIVGLGTGLNKLSVQIPGLMTAALLRNPPQAGTFGKGANEWPFIHVLDLAEAYAILLAKAVGLDSEGRPLADDVTPLAFGRQGVYYPASGHYTHSELAKQIASTLHRLAPDLVQTTEVTPFSQSDIDGSLYGKFAGKVYGGSIRVSSDKLPALGWKPTHPALEVTVEQDAVYQLERCRKGQLKGSKVSMDK